MSKLELFFRFVEILDCQLDDNKRAKLWELVSLVAES